MKTPSMPVRAVRPLLLCLLLAACASPPLQVYTLATGPRIDVPLDQSRRVTVVVAVARVGMPDDLDTSDILVRDGSVLRRSTLGRWGSRLSLAITDRLTSRLGARYPQFLVTDRPLTEEPAERLMVNIGRLDVTTAGVGTLDADWMVIPRDPRMPVRRDRVHLQLQGPVATDQDVVMLTGRMVDGLAQAINLGLR